VDKIVSDKNVMVTFASSLLSGDLYMPDVLKNGLEMKPSNIYSSNIKNGGCGLFSMVLASSELDNLENTVLLYL
jgi:hypothetical protein